VRRFRNGATQDITAHLFTLLREGQPRYHLYLNALMETHAGAIENAILGVVGQREADRQAEQIARLRERIFEGELSLEDYNLPLDPFARQYLEEADPLDRDLEKYGGMYFSTRMGERPEPYYLIFFNRYGKRVPIIPTSVVDLGISSYVDAVDRHEHIYKIQGFELTKDGWEPLEKPLEGVFALGRKLRKYELGFERYMMVYGAADPSKALQAYQQSLKAKSTLKEIQRDQASRVTRQTLPQESLPTETRQQTIGLLFGAEILKTIGEVPRSVIASALRTWFRRHGVQASVTVPRYSMASGVQFRIKDKATSAPALATISDIPPRDTLLLFYDMRENKRYDFLVYYPYTNDLAQLVASRLLAYIEKNPNDSYASITPEGRRIASGGPFTVSAVFGAGSQGPTSRA